MFTIKTVMDNLVKLPYILIILGLSTLAFSSYCQKVSAQDSASESRKRLGRVADSSEAKSEEEKKKQLHNSLDELKKAGSLSDSSDVVTTLSPSERYITQPTYGNPNITAGNNDESNQHHKPITGVETNSSGKLNVTEKVVAINQCDQNWIVCPPVDATPVQSVVYSPLIIFKSDIYDKSKGQVNYKNTKMVLYTEKPDTFVSLKEAKPSDAPITKPEGFDEMATLVETPERHIYRDLSSEHRVFDDPNYAKLQRKETLTKAEPIKEVKIDLLQNEAMIKRQQAKDQLGINDQLKLKKVETITYNLRIELLKSEELRRLFSFMVERDISQLRSDKFMLTPSLQISRILVDDASPAQKTISSYGWIDRRDLDSEVPNISFDGSSARNINYEPLFVLFNLVSNKTSTKSHTVKELLKFTFNERLDLKEKQVDTQTIQLFCYTEKDNVIRFYAIESAIDCQ